MISSAQNGKNGDYQINFSPTKQWIPISVPYRDDGFACAVASHRLRGDLRSPNTVSGINLRVILTVGQANGSAFFEETHVNLEMQDLIASLK